MSDEKRALTRHSAPPGEADYEAILAAVMETGRGRWFLHEFAQRNRHAETRGVLTAIERIEGMLRAQGGDDPRLPAPAAAGQIATAIARAREMVAASAGNDAQAFEQVGQTLENAQVRIRGVYTRLRDAALSLRDEGGHSRICNELDRLVRDLDTGCAQMEDASGDIRILIALLKDIESLAAESAPSHQGTPPAGAPRPVPEALVVTPSAVPPQPQNDPVETGLMVSDTVSLEELDACIAEFEGNESAFAATDAAATDSPSLAASMATADAADLTAPAEPATPAEHAAPAELSERAELAELAKPADPAAAGLTATNPSRTIAADALLAEPAEFLLEPLPGNDQDPAIDDDTAIALKIEPDVPDMKPLAPLHIDSFDPLAPLRGLSDEEKIALFS